MKTKTLKLSGNMIDVPFTPPAASSVPAPADSDTCTGEVEKCPDCSHPFTAGHHMAGEPCPASPSWLPAPAGVTGEPVRKVQSGIVAMKACLDASKGRSPAEPAKVLGGILPHLNLRIVHPWLAVVDGDEPEDRGIAKFEAYGDKLTEKELDRANALITACNSHAAHLAKIQALTEALREIETICTESAGECRKRMGTRVGNILVTARAALSLPSA